MGLVGPQGMKKGQTWAMPGSGPVSAQYRLNIGSVSAQDRPWRGPC